MADAVIERSVQMACTVLVKSIAVSINHRTQTTFPSDQPEDAAHRHFRSDRSAALNLRRSRDPGSVKLIDNRFSNCRELFNFTSSRPFDNKLIKNVQNGCGTTLNVRSSIEQPTRFVGFTQPAAAAAAAAHEDKTMARREKTTRRQIVLSKLQIVRQRE